MQQILECFPHDARPLLVGRGSELVDRIGPDAVRAVVADVLHGRNVRASTERLTATRIAKLNGAVVSWFACMMAETPELLDRLGSIVARGLAGPLDDPDRTLLRWLVGMTGKTAQNVLRDDPTGLEQYGAAYSAGVHESVAAVESSYGPFRAHVVAGRHEFALGWYPLLLLLSTVGAQTLATRGSEKSMYGKLFERLILGSALHALGLRLVTYDTLQPDDANVFWLTSRNEKRESDATMIGEAGRGARFDIGFIGKGNPEITLDKVSRFERGIELGGRKREMTTVILVDTIPATGSVAANAEQINGIVIEMSAPYWPRLLAHHLLDKAGFASPFLDVSDNDYTALVADRMRTVPLAEIAVKAAAGDDVPETIVADVGEGYDHMTGAHAG